VRESLFRSLLALDATMLGLLVRPVAWVRRLTGWGNWRQARLMVGLSPILLGMWWVARWQAMDFWFVNAMLVWSSCCWLRIKEFQLEERVMLFYLEQGKFFITVQSAMFRVAILVMFVFLDATRTTLAFTLNVAAWRVVLMSMSFFYCTLFALALYVHALPPNLEPPKRRKRDWLKWLRWRPVPVPVPT
jgi:hypothetical protein